MPSAARVIALVGGEQVFGQPVASHLDIARAVRGGLHVEAIDYLIDRHLVTAAEIDRIIVPRKTLADRRRKGSLTPEQSDRVIRVARIISDALETFGSQEKALTWLRRGCAPLQGDAPLDLLDTEEGAREVEHLIGRIAHGLVA